MPQYEKTRKRTRVKQAGSLPVAISIFFALALARDVSSSAFRAVGAFSCRALSTHARARAQSIPNHCRGFHIPCEGTDFRFRRSHLVINAASSQALLDILMPLPERDVNRIGPTQLAFVGDIVYELHVRSRYLWPSRRTSDLQSIVVAAVNADAQSKVLASLTESFPLTEKEQGVLSRGRNTKSGSRGKKKNAATYQDSTAFEALIGYMYMEDEIRCFEMLNWIRREQRDLDEAQGVQVVSAGNPAEPESLLELLQPRSDCDVDRIAPAQLAYIGDSVYELLARNRYVWPHRRTADLHQKVVGVSRAETQSEIYKALTRDETSGVELTTAEKSILTRGRNAAGGSGGRNKNMNRARKEEEGGGAAMHQEAAALEALLGHAFIEDPARCLELLRWLSLQLDAVDFA